MAGHVGLTPVPDDGDIQKFMTALQAQHSVQLLDMVGELFDTLHETVAENQPRIFAYGKLVNYLASDKITQPELHAICAAALWHIVSQ